MKAHRSHVIVLIERLDVDTVIGHLRKDVIKRVPAMHAGLGSNHGSKPEVLADMLLFSFVMDLAENFNYFPTSEVNPQLL